MIQMFEIRDQRGPIGRIMAICANSSVKRGAIDGRTCSVKSWLGVASRAVVFKDSLPITHSQLHVTHPVDVEPSRRGRLLGGRGYIDLDQERLDPRGCIGGVGRFPRF